MSVVRIATRGSDLALAQANTIAERIRGALERAQPEEDVRTGDRSGPGCVRLPLPRRPYEIAHECDGAGVKLLPSTWRRSHVGQHDQRASRRLGHEVRKTLVRSLTGRLGDPVQHDDRAATDPPLERARLCVRNVSDEGGVWPTD